MKSIRITEDLTLYSIDDGIITAIRDYLLAHSEEFSTYIHMDWTHYTRDYELKLLLPHLQQENRVLEIGSGDGYNAQRLMSDHGVNVVPTDPRPRFPQYTEVTTVDAQHTRLRESQFDRIISLHVMEHIPNLDEAFREFHRLLKDDGLMLHIVPTPAAMLLTAILQPLAYLRMVHLYLSGWFGRQFRPLRGRNILRLVSHILRNANPFNILWGPGHGTNRRHKCLTEWRDHRWRERFHRAGFAVEEVIPSETCYSMHKLFPFRLLQLRRFLAKSGLSASRLYVLRDRTRK